MSCVWFSLVLVALLQMRRSEPKVTDCAYSEDVRARYSKHLLESFCSEELTWRTKANAPNQRSYEDTLTPKQLEYFKSFQTCRSVRCAMKQTTTTMTPTTTVSLDDTSSEIVIRPEYQQMTDDERKAFHEAFDKLNEERVDNRSKYEILTGHYGNPEFCPSSRFGPGYLSFHRELLRIIENALRQINLNVSIPYLDPSTDSADSAIWAHDFGADANSITKQEYYDPLNHATIIVWIIIGQADALYRPDDRHQIFPRNSSDPKYCRDRAVELSALRTRRGLNGMSEIDRSLGHPSALFHHSFVDSIWEDFRRLNQTKMQRETDYPAGDDNKCDKFHAPKAPMKPFGITNEEGLSDEFTKTHQYQPQRTCSAANPNCRCEWLFCDTANSRCISRIKVGGNCSNWQSCKDVCHKSSCVDGICQLAAANDTNEPPVTKTTVQPEASTKFSKDAVSPMDDGLVVSTAPQSEPAATKGSTAPSGSPATAATMTTLKPSTTVPVVSQTKPVTGCKFSPKLLERFDIKFLESSCKMKQTWEAGIPKGQTLIPDHRRRRRLVSDSVSLTLRQKDYANSLQQSREALLQTRNRRNAYASNSSATQGDTMPQLNFPRAQRKEYRMLTDLERSDFHAALNALKEDKIDGRSKLDILTIFHRADHAPEAYFGAAFLPFHRELLTQLELALCQENVNVSLPYLDSTLDSGLPNPHDSVIWTKSFLGCNNDSIKDGPFANWPSSSEGRLLTRIAGPSDGLYTHADLEQIAKFSHYNHLVYCADPFFELLSTGFHLFVGGDMAHLEASTSDPAYFLHYAFADSIWEEFRQKRQKPEERAKDLGKPCRRGVDGVDDQMRPFNVNMKMTNNMLNVDGLSSDYTDRLYLFADRPRCSEDQPDCGSPYLFCDVLNQRCVSKIRLGGNCGFSEPRMAASACFQGYCDAGICVPIALRKDSVS